MAIACVDVKVLKDKSVIDRIEDKYDIYFSEDFKKFFRENNGGIPKKNIFNVNGKEYEIRCFLSFNEGEYNSIRKPLAWFQEKTHGKIVPVAKDSGDNYYCVNLETEKIYFWDKDDNLYYCVAASFAEFIGYL